MTGNSESTEQDSPHRCSCHNGHRRMALVVGRGKDVPEELALMVEKFAWQYEPQLGVVEVKIGRGLDVNDSGALHDLLSAILSPDEFKRIRACWLDAEGTLHDQLFQIVNAQALSCVLKGGDGWLQAMIQDNRLESWFQPVINVSNMQVWGFECLIRGRRKNGDLVGAFDIIKAAEHENLLFMLDRHCRETHIRSAATLQLSQHIRFLINFLPNVIYQPEFCLKTTLNAASKHGIVAERIIFEVVETEKVEDTEHLKSVLRFYRDNGFGIALDDVGSGYSGLSWMAELAPDLIKIDRGIISRAVDSSAHSLIAKAIIELGHSSNQLVLAEGVETEAEFELMRELGVDLCQGYYFGKPSPEVSELYVPS